MQSALNMPCGSSPHQQQCSMKQRYSKLLWALCLTFAIFCAILPYCYLLILVLHTSFTSCLGFAHTVAQLMSSLPVWTSLYQLSHFVYPKPCFHYSCTTAAPQHDLFQACNCVLQAKLKSCKAAHVSRSPETGYEWLISTQTSSQEAEALQVSAAVPLCVL